MRKIYGIGALVGLALIVLGRVLANRRHSLQRLPTLLIGDSLGVGLAAAFRTLGLSVESIALSGTTVDYWTNAGKAKLQALLGTNPGSMFVSLGANDAYNGDSYASTAAASTRALLALISGPTLAGPQVFWIGPPKLPPTYGGKAVSQAVLDAIRQVVDATPGATWIDSSAFEIVRSDDHLHPTTAGYSQWAALLVASLGASFVTPSPVAMKGGIGGLSLGADDSEEPIPRPAPPTVVLSPPPGWVHRKEATAPMMAFAISVLAQRRPMGDVQTAVLDGSRIGALTEWHWDNHVDHTWKWHRGISLLAPVA